MQAGQKTASSQLNINLKFIDIYGNSADWPLLAPTRCPQH